MSGDLPVRMTPSTAPARPARPPRALPDKASFALGDVVYLDSGSQHPISSSGRAAVEKYLAMQPQR